MLDVGRSDVVRCTRDCWTLDIGLWTERWTLDV